MTRCLCAGVAVLALQLAGCGGGGSSGNSTGGTTTGAGDPPPAAAVNVQTLTVEAGPSNFVNTLFTDVTVCVPGSTACQTVDHVLVDTGSTGLRLMASVLQSSLVLPQQTDAGGNAIAECTQFADGFTWGPIKIADVRIAGEQADGVPIQVIGDPAYGTVPNECVNTGPDESSVAAFGANGVLGVGVFKQDCGPACVSAGNGFYYLCPCGQSSTSGGVALATQVQNPVAMFANDNNGVIIQLPAVDAAGAVSITGSIIFGIGTRDNNGLGTARVLTVDAGTGTFVTRYKNKLYNVSLLDSGSSVTFFADSAIQTCDQADLYAPGFYCPAAAQDLSADITAADNAGASLGFQVGNAHNLFSAHGDYWVFNNLAAPAILSNSFIWGLPSFMGRTVYTAFEGQTTPGGAGPYFAF